MIPLEVSTKKIKEILKREHPISGMPLEKEELKKVYPYVQGYIELCWHDDLEFYLEGMNLPDDWKESRLTHTTDLMMRRSRRSYQLLSRSALQS